jgi:hypothetical protein
VLVFFAALATRRMALASAGFPVESLTGSRRFTSD